MSVISEDLDLFKNEIQGKEQLIGIDFGIKKIGVAITSPSGSMAIPLCMLINNDYIFDNIKKIILQHNITGCVVGIPVNMDGSFSESTVRAKNFALKLASVMHMPVLLQDERRTSKAANNLLAIAGYNRKQRDALDDSIAASLILESAISRIKAK